jgi:hypothetical protein
MDRIDILGKRKSGGIESLLDGYMGRFKVYDKGTLFDTNDEWKLIRSGVCPVCLCQLKVSKKGDVYCKSVAHKKISKKGLFVPAESFNKFNK